MKIGTSITPFLAVITLCAQGQTITTVAGNGTQGYNGDNIAATSAEIRQPFGITFDASGNMYFVDIDNMRIRKVAAANGIITTVAGTGTDGYNGDNILATTAELSAPVGIALDAAGNIYITEQDNDDVRMITASTGIITTIAGTRNFGYNGDSIPATTADLFWPGGIAVDAGGNVYFTDESNQRIRKINASTGMITTVAGTGTGGYNGDNIAATAAEVYYPLGIKLDALGNIYFADCSNNRIRMINASSGIITTVAGNGTQGYNADNIVATTAELYAPIDLYVDVFPDIYIADEGNNRIRKVSASTGIITTVAGTGVAGYNDGRHGIPLDSGIE